MPFSDWLPYLLSFPLYIVSSLAVVNKMTAASLRFRSVCEENLDKVLNDQNN